jgi:hypothetical protein
MVDVVHQFPKNATEEVRASLTEYKGHKLIDLRIYYEPEEGGERRPTKKGVTIDVGLYPELKKAMMKMERELIRKALLKQDVLEGLDRELAEREG